MFELVHSIHVPDVLMFIAFGVILPISMMMFYFGRSCKMSLERRTQIHYIGYILTAILYAIALTLDIISGRFKLHSLNTILELAMCLIMMISICMFATMRRYKYSLRIWLDFVLCFALWALSSYLMVRRVSSDSPSIYSYGLIAWTAFIVALFVTLAFISYLTSETIKFTMVIARGEDIGPCDGSMYHDDDEDLDEEIIHETKGLNNNNGRKESGSRRSGSGGRGSGRTRIPFTMTASNTVSSEMERVPDEMCMV